MPGISSGGFGRRWVFSTQYNNSTGADFDQGMGSNWMATSVPTLAGSAWSAADISFRTQSGAMRYMKQTGTGTFSSMFGDRSILSHNATTHEYTYVESDGTKTIFNDLTHTTAPGQMTSQVAPGGQTTTLTGTIGASLDAQRINTTGGVTRFESFLQNYYASGSSVGKLQSVLLRRGDAGQPWENIERLTLTYYDGTTSYGSLNDLKSSTKEIWDGSAWVAPKVTYYRYYIAGVNTDIGFVHGLRYVVNPAAWEKMVSDSIDPLTAADSVIAQYADRYFQYDPYTRRVNYWATNGGTQSFQLSYSYNSHSVGTPAPFGSWVQKSSLTLQDGSNQIGRAHV